MGLSFLEIAAVHPSTPGPILAFRDGVQDGYRRVADAIHRHGMRVFQQLWHGGSSASPLDGGPAWAPSTVPEPLQGRTPLPMTQGMIDEVVADLVVFETGAVPRRELSDALVARGIETHLAGDAFAARDMQHAFASGRRAGSAV